MQSSNEHGFGGDEGVAQAGGPASKAKQKLQELGETVKEQAGVVKEQVKHSAQQAAEQLKKRSTSVLDHQKERAAEEIHHFATAIREISGKLHEQNAESVARYTDMLAERVDHTSEYLRGKDVNELINDVSGFIRRRPEVMIGAAIVAGLAVARFLKASRPEGSYGGSDFSNPNFETSAASQQRFGGYGSNAGDLGAGEGELGYVGGTEPGAIGDWAQRTSDVGGLGRSDRDDIAPPTADFENRQ